MKSSRAKVWITHLATEPQSLAAKRIFVELGLEGGAIITAKKATQFFWESTWEKARYNTYIGIERYLAINVRLDAELKKYLRRGEKKVVELGCSKGKRLILFNKIFGYDIYGIDRSRKGVEAARNNLSIAHIKGTILCEDIFHTSLETESFDVVYSSGLIEHFDNPSEIIEQHIKLLKEGGLLLITIPNYNNSLYFHIQKLRGTQQNIIETHNMTIMDLTQFTALFKQSEIDILKLNYFGPIDLTLAFNQTGRFFTLLLQLLNQCIGYTTLCLPPSKFFSPYLILIAKKSNRHRQS